MLSSFAPCFATYLDPVTTQQCTCSFKQAADQWWFALHGFACNTPYKDFKRDPEEHNAIQECLALKIWGVNLFARRRPFSTLRHFTQADQLCKLCNCSLSNQHLGKGMNETLPKFTGHDVPGALHECSKHCFPTAKVFAESLVTCFLCLISLVGLSDRFRPLKTASIGTATHDFHGCLGWPVAWTKAKPLASHGRRIVISNT